MRRWAKRCTAHRSNGQPCGNYAIRGGYVCMAHGGAAPQVRAAADRRFAEWKARIYVDREVRRRAQERARARVDETREVAAALGLDPDDPAADTRRARFAVAIARGLGEDPRTVYEAAPAD